MVTLYLIIAARKVLRKLEVFKSKEGTIILHMVLYGCETWSLTLRKQHRLRVFVNKLLTRIFGSKRNEVKGGWRNLYN
jgi:hypothetical protein